MNTSDKYKKKVILLKESDIAEIQTMLEKEASEGWFFVEKKACIYTFEKKQKKKLKFRLLPSEDILSVKEIEKYKEDGWEYIGNLGKTAMFCAKKNEKKIKLQPKKTNNIVRKLKSEINFQIGFSFAIIVLAVVSWIVVTFSKGFFWKNIVGNWNITIAIPIVYIALIMFSIMLLIDKIGVYNVLRQLPIEDKGNEKKKKIMYITRVASMAVVLIIAIIMFTFTIVMLLQGVNKRECLKYKGDNIVGLMDVEEIYEYYTEAQFNNLGRVQSVNTTPVYKGKYSTGKSLLCKETITWEENLSNDVKKYYANLKGEYYNIYSKNIAKNLYKELVDNMNKEKVEFEKIASEKLKKYDFDEVFVCNVEQICKIVVRKDSEIYSIEFYGDKGYEEALECILNIYKKRILEK